MQFTSFNPISGDIGTNVTLSLTDMPQDAGPDNTSVQLSGSATVDVTSVNVLPDNSGTIQVTIEENSQSGDFAVIVMSEQGAVYAQSAQVFTVNQPGGQPQFTNMQPRQVVAGKSSQLTLTGRDLDQISAVNIGSVRVNSLQRSGTTQIRLLVPSAVQAGSQRVYGSSAEYGQVKVPYMLTVAAAQVNPTLGTAPPRTMLDACQGGLVTLQLRTPAGRVPAK